MAPPLPKDVVLSIECAIELALNADRKPDRNSIAVIFHTTYRTVGNIEKRVEQRRIHGPIPHKKSGRPPQITPEIVEAVKGLMERRPALDQYAIADYIREEFGISMNQSSVSKLLKAHDIPHKRTNALHRKMKILPSKEWDKVTIPRKQSYVSPYAAPPAAPVPIANIAYAPAMMMPQSNITYFGPYS